MAERIGGSSTTAVATRAASSGSMSRSTFSSSGETRSVTQSGFNAAGMKRNFDMARSATGSSGVREGRIDMQSSRKTWQAPRKISTGNAEAAKVGQWSRPPAIGQPSSDGQVHGFKLNLPEIKIIHTFTQKTEAQKPRLAYARNENKAPYIFTQKEKVQAIERQIKILPINKPTQERQTASLPMAEQRLQELRQQIHVLRITKPAPELKVPNQSKIAIAAEKSIGSSVATTRLIEQKTAFKLDSASAAIQQLMKRTEAKVAVEQGKMKSTLPFEVRLQKLQEKITAVKEQIRMNTEKKAKIKMQLKEKPLDAETKLFYIEDPQRSKLRIQAILELYGKLSHNGKYGVDGRVLAQNLNRRDLLSIPVIMYGKEKDGGLERARYMLSLTRIETPMQAENIARNIIAWNPAIKIGKNQPDNRIDNEYVHLVLQGGEAEEEKHYYKVIERMYQQVSSANYANAA